MLYDPDQHKAPPATAEPSLAGFAAWCEAKDPQESYNLYDATLCAYGQYFRSVGRDPIAQFSLIGSALGVPSTVAHGVVAGATDDKANWTFGQAARRARAALAARAL
jgi:hypothetical protein